MEEQLKQYLSEFVETLKAGGEFAMEQLPIFVHEYLAWSIAIHAILVVVSLVFLFISYKLTRNIFREFSKEKNDNEFLTENTRYSYEKYNVTLIGTIHNIVAPLSFVIGFPIFLINIYQLSMVVLAPRVYLIKNLLQLIN